MKSSDALLIAWERTAARAPDRPAVIATTGKIAQTFADIELRARQLENRLQGLVPGSVIAIQIGNNADWPALFIACLRRQLVVLPLDQSLSERQQRAALDLCRARAVAVARSGTPDWKLLQPRRTAPAAYWGDNSPTLLKLTSGTTATPRAIRFRSEHLLADCEQICETMGISEADLNFGVIPISHSYGFSNLLTPLIVHGVSLVLSNDRTPRAVLQDIRETGATVLPATPVFYKAFCEIEAVPAIPTLQTCISAGAPLSLFVAKRFRERFHRPIHSFYGASECGGICYDRSGNIDVEGFVGEPMAGVNVSSIDPTASSSEVRVRSAAVGDAYFPQADPDKLNDGVFVPDDLLERIDRGFRIVGRVSELINVAGKKVNPAEVEAHLRRCRGVREAVVFGRRSAHRNEEIAACVVTGSSINENKLLEFARQGLSPWQVPKRVFVVDRIPTNERGKVSRRELAERFAN